MAHVRSAFSGIGGKQLGIEFNHPFDGNFFILEHNGVLQYKDTEREVPKDKIDSQIFLQELDKAYEMDTDVIRALQTTMELFTGKFAFIIFNKSSNKYYAVRGKTADLHMSYISIANVQLGYVLNTNKITLEETIAQVVTIYSILGLELKFTVPINVKEESIFELLENEVKLVGEIKESDTPVKSTYINMGAITRFPYEDTDYGYNYRSGGIIGDYYTPHTKKICPPDANSPEATLYLLMDYHLLSIADVDVIAEEAIGFGLLELTREQIVRLVYIVQALCKKNNKRYKRLWNKITDFLDSDLVYKTPGISFPYFLTPIDKLYEVKRKCKY
jgi:hypothetical protein